MSIFLTYLESNLTSFTHSHVKEDWKEKVWRLAEQRSGLRRERLIMVIVVFVSTYIALGSILPLISYLTCTLIPMMSSFKMISGSSRAMETRKDTQLLYWCLFLVWTLLDFSPVVSIPFYYFIKTAFFIYLYAPSTMGINKVSQQLGPAIRVIDCWFHGPIVEERIDNSIEKNE